MRRFILLLAVTALAGCARSSRPSFPPPARPPVFIQLDFETAYAQLHGVLESRGYPLVVEDQTFGSVRTDWVYYDPGEVDVRVLAACPAPQAGFAPRHRARYGFDVRRRTVQTTVTILSHWQVERPGGMEGDSQADQNYADCRSTGEWERLIESLLTQRGTIR